MCIIILDVFSLKVTAPNLLSVVGVHARTGTKFQAGKSHTHLDHSIHPTHSETWTTLLAYLYDHQKSLVGAMENNKRFSFELLFHFPFPFLNFLQYLCHSLLSCTCHFFTSRSTVINRTVSTSPCCKTTTSLQFVCT